MSKIRVITLKKDVPYDTVSRPGFHLLNMGKEGTWLVDQDHPGYPGCVKKALKIAIKDVDSDRVMRYQKLINSYTDQTVIKLSPEAKAIADSIDKKV